MSDPLVEQIHREVEAWCNENIVGQQSSQRLLESAEVEIRHMYAARLRAHPEDIHLVNYRMADDGMTIAWDGIEVSGLDRE
jgi:hypothetical protein